MTQGLSVILATKLAPNASLGFIGGVIVLIGTAGVVISLKPDYEWDEKASAYGTIFIGLGTAIAFSESSLSYGEHHVRLSVFALLVVAVTILFLYAGPLVQSRITRHRQRDSDEKGDD
jgi:hypothetical protein